MVCPSVDYLSLRWNSWHHLVDDLSATKFHPESPISRITYSTNSLLLRQSESTTRDQSQQTVNSLSYKFSEVRLKRWLEVKSTCYTCRELEFGFHHPHWEVDERLLLQF